MTRPTVTIQISPESQPSTPSWFSEAAVFAQILTHEGILKTIQEQVRFARARFGHYDLVDFVAVLIGYILSGEPTLWRFTNDLLRLPDHLWLSSDETSCPIAPPCLGFWLPLI